MLTNDILSVLVTIAGVDRATKDLQRIQDELQETADKAQLIGAAGAAMALTGAAVGGVAVKQFEDMESFRRVFQLTAGEIKGARLAEEVMQFAKEASTSTAVLREMAGVWMGMTGDSDRMMETIKALEKAKIAGGLSDDAVSRAGLALAQLRSLPTTTWEDIKQLAQNGVPLQMVAKDLGLESVRDLAGMDSGEFIDAFNRVMNKLPDKQLLGSQALANALETMMIALEPTGRLLSVFVGWVAAGIGFFANMFDWLNKATGGVAGLVLVVGLVGGGLRMMWVAARMMIKGLWDASWALQALATSARAAATANATSGTASAAGSAAGAAGAAAGWAGIAAMLTRVGGIIMTTLHVLKFAFTTVILPILGTIAAAVAIIGGIAAIGIWIINGMANIAKGKHFNDGVAETVGGGIENVKKFGRWATGQNEPEDANKPKPADRAIQRSSIENVWDKAYGRRMST